MHHIGMKGVEVHPHAIDSLSIHLQRHESGGYVQRIRSSMLSGGEVFRTLVSRSQRGLRVQDPSTLSGPTAIRWGGPSYLTGVTTEGSASVVNTPKPLSREEDELARDIYSREVDRLGYRRPTASGRRAAKALEIDPEKSFPPHRNALGSALMVRRNLVTRLSVRTLKALWIQELTVREWRLPAEDKELLQGLEVHGRSILRSYLTGSRRQYSGHANLEVYAALGHQTVHTAVDVKDGCLVETLNHAALEVLVKSATAAVLARNPKFAVKLLERSITIGWHFTKDAYASFLPCSLPDIDIDKVIPAGDINVDNKERSAILHSWQAACAAGARKVEAYILEETKQRDSVKSNVVKASMHIPHAHRTLMREATLAASTAVIVTRTREQARTRELMRDTMRSGPREMVTTVPAAMRMLLFTYSQAKVGRALALYRSRPRNLHDCLKINDVKGIPEDYRRMVVELVPEDIAEQIATLIRFYGEGETVTWEHILRFSRTKRRVDASAGLRKKAYSDSRIIKWVSASAANVVKSLDRIGAEVKDSYAAVSIGSAIHRAVKGKLRTWCGHLANPSRSQEEWIELLRKQGRTQTTGRLEVYGEGLIQFDVDTMGDIGVTVESEEEWLRQVQKGAPIDLECAKRVNLILRQNTCAVLRHAEVRLIGDKISIGIDSERLLNALKPAAERRLVNYRSRLSKKESKRESKKIEKYVQDVRKAKTIDELQGLVESMGRRIFLVPLSLSVMAATQRMSMILSDVQDELTKIIPPDEIDDVDRGGIIHLGPNYSEPVRESAVVTAARAKERQEEKGATPVVVDPELDDLFDLLDFESIEPTAPIVQPYSWRQVVTHPLITKLYPVGFDVASDIAAYLPEFKVADIDEEVSSSQCMLLQFPVLPELEDFVTDFRSRLMMASPELWGKRKKQSRTHEYRM